MKAYKLMFAAAIVMLAACSKGQETNGSTEPGNGNEPATQKTFAFTATAEGDDPADKAKLDMSGAKPKTYWENGDQIKVWSDADAAAGYIFSTELVSPAATADFTYTGNFPEGGKYAAVHPAKGDESSNLDIPLITHAVVIPSTQSLEEGGINKNYLSAAAYTKGENTLAFKNTTSLVKFQVGDNRVFSGTVKTSEGEQIAGTYSVTFDNDGIPAISTTNTARETITFKLADETALSTGKEYYVAVAPNASLADGFTVTFKNTTTDPRLINQEDGKPMAGSDISKTYEVASLERNKIYNVGDASSNEHVSRIVLHFHFNDENAYTNSATSWPTAQSAISNLSGDETRDCTFTLNNQVFTFSLAATLDGGNGPYISSKQVAIVKESYLGLPAIEGFKLVKVSVFNKKKGADSEAGICKNRQSKEAEKETVAGGEFKQPTYNALTDWELTGTEAGKVYWLYNNHSKNTLLSNHFYLTYEKVQGE